MKTKILVFLGLVAILSACASSARRSVSPAPTPTPTVRPLEIRAQATLIRQYFLPTLKDFAHDPFVTGVIEGDVTDAVTTIRDEQGSVGTTLTVQVKRGWGVSGTTIAVTEYGGVVPLRKVRSSFEGKEWQKPLTEDDLARPVEYRMERFPPTHVGDHVVLLVTTASDGTYALAAKLVQSGTSFGWAEDEAPNQIWARQYTTAEVDDLVAGR